MSSIVRHRANGTTRPDKFTNPAAVIATARITAAPDGIAARERSVRHGSDWKLAKEALDPGQCLLEFR